MIPKCAWCGEYRAYPGSDFCSLCRPEKDPNYKAPPKIEPRANVKPTKSPFDERTTKGVPGNAVQGAWRRSRSGSWKRS